MTSVWPLPNTSGNDGDVLTFEAYARSMHPAEGGYSYARPWTHDGDLSNNTAAVTTTVRYAFDLLPLQNLPATVTGGSRITWTVVMSNAGPARADEPTLWIALPDELTNIAYVRSDSGTCAQVYGTLRCGFPLHSGVAADDALTVTFNAYVTAVVADTVLTSVAGIDVAVPSLELEASNNIVTSTMTIKANSLPTLSMHQSVLSDTVVEGTLVTYTVVLTKSGVLSENVTARVNDVLPVRINDLVAATSSAGSCAQLMDTEGAPTSEYQCDVPLSAGQPVTITFAVWHRARGTFVNTATAVFNGLSASAATTVTVTGEGTLALSVSKTAGRGIVIGYRTPPYVIVVSNTGTVAVDNIVIQDPLPNINANELQPVDRCSGGYFSPVICQVGMLNPGESFTATIGTYTEEGPLGDGVVFTNTATILAPMLATPLEASAVVTSYATGIDLSAQFSAVPITATVGDVITYSLLIASYGDDSGAAITVSLPSQFTLAGCEFQYLIEGTCEAEGVDGGRVVTVAWDTLNGGAYGYLNIGVVANEPITTDTAISLTAFITTTGGAEDLWPANNLAGPVTTRLIAVGGAATPTPTPTEVATATPTGTPTATPTHTITPTLVDTSIPTDTATPTPTATNTPVDTSTPTDTATPTPTVTNTPVDTSTPTDAATPAATRTPTGTPSPIPTPSTTVIPRRYLAFLSMVTRGDIAADFDPKPELAARVQVELAAIGQAPQPQPILISVMVSNRGDMPAKDFWVELYADPSRTPRVNDRWDQLCQTPWPASTCYGGSWFVAQALAPGQSVTLTSADLLTDTEYSHWTGRLSMSADTRLVVYVDSFGANGAYGAVRERDEQNNLFVWSQN